MGAGAIITSLLFGFIHGFEINSNLEIQFTLFPMLIPLLGGFVLAWLISRSGSLVLPIIVHNFMNEVANIIATIK